MSSPANRVRWDSVKAVGLELVKHLRATIPDQEHTAEFLSYLFNQTAQHRSEHLIELYPTFAMYCGEQDHGALDRPAWAAAIKWSVLRAHDRTA